MKVLLLLNDSAHQSMCYLFVTTLLPPVMQRSLLNDVQDSLLLRLGNVKWMTSLLFPWNCYNIVTCVSAKRYWWSTSARNKPYASVCAFCVMKKKNRFPPFVDLKGYRTPEPKTRTAQSQLLLKWQAIERNTLTQTPCYAREVIRFL